MKSKFFAMVIGNLLVFSANATIINLGVGDTVTLQPNRSTTVTCGMGNANTCQLPVRNIETRLQACAGQGNTIEDCLTEHWPVFKKKNPTCVEEAYESCIGFCRTSPDQLYCVELCQ